MASRRAALLGGAMACAGVPAWAQVPVSPAASPDKGAIEQVVVTALRQRTSLQKAPAAITAISAAELDRANITTLAGLNNTVPGLNITRAAGFENLVNIRGVGSATPENSAVTQPGVAVFVDGVYINNSIALDESLFDLARIEVLRGPQGTLYAQSSTGGVISLVTNQPVLGRTSGTAEFSAGTHGLLRERLTVNVPVSDSIAIRASLQKYDRDGYGHEIGRDYALDDQHEYSGKVAILWKPSADFTATLSAQKYQSNQHGAEQQNILDPSTDPRAVNQDYPARFTLHSQLVHLNLDWQTPVGTVESVTGYQAFRNTQSFDSLRLSQLLAGGYDLVPAYNTHAQSYTQEISLRSVPGGRIDYVTGVFAEKARTSQFVAEFKGGLGVPDIAVLPDIQTSQPANLSFGNVNVVNRIAVAPYAQATWHVTPALRLVGGVRFNYDRYNSFNFSFSGKNFGSGYSKLNTIDSTRRVTGNLALQYDVSPTTMLYASVTEGYKPGGVNGNPSAVVVRHIFNPEEITAFELGSKSTLLDNHLRLNTAAFFYDYRKMQYIEVDPVPFNYGIANVPDAHIYGVESEASYLTLKDRLRLNANVAFESGKLEGSYRAIDQSIANGVIASNPACGPFGAYSNPVCQNAIIAAARPVDGNRPPQIPLLQLAVNATYTMDVLTGTHLAGQLASRAEFVFRSSEYARIFNDPVLDKIGGYGLVNLDFRYQPDREHYRLELAISNIADRAGVNARYTDPYGSATTSQAYVAPRQVVGTLAYDF